MLTKLQEGTCRQVREGKSREEQIENLHCQRKTFWLVDMLHTGSRRVDHRRVKSVLYQTCAIGILRLALSCVPGLEALKANRSSVVGDKFSWDTILLELQCVYTDEIAKKSTNPSSLPYLSYILYTAICKAKSPDVGDQDNMTSPYIHLRRERGGRR